MEKLNTKSLSLSIGFTSVTIYILCVISLLIIGEEGISKLANLFFHGLELKNNIRMSISFIESIIGALITFLFWTLIGFLIALFYNMDNFKKT